MTNSNDGYWQSAYGSLYGVMEAFTILSKFTKCPDSLLICHQSDTVDVIRGFADFRKFLQVLEEALVRMVLLPEFEKFFGTWKHFFIDNACYEAEVKYLMEINGDL